MGLGRGAHTVVSHSRVSSPLFSPSVHLVGSNLVEVLDPHPPRPDFKLETENRVNLDCLFLSTFEARRPVRERIAHSDILSLLVRAFLGCQLLGHLDLSELLLNRVMVVPFSLGSHFALFPRPRLGRDASVTAFGFDV